NVEFRVGGTRDIAFAGHNTKNLLRITSYLKLEMLARVHCADAEPPALHTTLRFVRKIGAPHAPRLIRYTSPETTLTAGETPAFDSIRGKSRQRCWREDRVDVGFPCMGTGGRPCHVPHQRGRDARAPRALHAEISTL